MKKIGFIQSDPEEKLPKATPSEKLAIEYIEQNYTPTGDVEKKEFRTTLELIVEMSEMVAIDMSGLNSILMEKGFNTIFIEGVSNWVMYDRN